MSTVYVVLRHGLCDEVTPKVVCASEETAEKWISSTKEGAHSEIHHYQIEEIPFLSDFTHPHHWPKD